MLPTYEELKIRFDCFQQTGRLRLLEQAYDRFGFENMNMRGDTGWLTAANWIEEEGDIELANVVRKIAAMGSEPSWVSDLVRVVFFLSEPKQLGA